MISDSQNCWICKMNQCSWQGLIYCLQLDLLDCSPGFTWFAVWGILSTDLQTTLQCWSMGQATVLQVSTGGKLERRLNAVTITMFLMMQSRQGFCFGVWLNSDGQVTTTACRQVIDQSRSHHADDSASLASISGCQAVEQKIREFVLWADVWWEEKVHFTVLIEYNAAYYY